MKYIKLIIIIIIIAISSTALHAKPSDSEIAKSKAKAFFVAMANGDVPKLKQLLTSDFYNEHFPYSDARVREILLSVPAQRRQKAIDHIQNNSTASIIINRAGDVITVVLKNKITQKEIAVQLLDCDGDWKVCDYWY